MLPFLAQRHAQSTWRTFSALRTCRKCQVSNDGHHLAGAVAAAAAGEMGAGASTVPNAVAAQEQMQATPRGTSPADDKRASAGLVFDEIVGKRTRVSWREYKEVCVFEWRDDRTRALSKAVRALDH